MKKFYLLTLCFAVFLSGCDKKEVPGSHQNLTIEQTEYTLGAFENRTATITFTATDNWTLTITSDNPATAWITANTAGGTAGSNTVVLYARMNFGETNRTAYVEISCEEQTAKLTVTQDISEETDFTSLFDPIFAIALEARSFITNAGKITRQDMEEIAKTSLLALPDDYEIPDIPAPLTSLRGIEYFESMENLYCNFHPIESLDLSQNTELGYLDCNGCKLTVLDVSQNTKLEKLYCTDNKLTALDVSHNAALESLACSGNDLKTLDISRNTELESLICDECGLAELDVSQNTKLDYLACSDNDLKTLDINRNTELKTIYCDNNGLESLDISQNMYLETLQCENNPGDRVSTFPITAWFDELPESLFVNEKSWDYEGKTITISFQKDI